MGVQGKRIDMIGKTYNSWKIIRALRTEYKIVYYLAICLECNREFEVDGRNVRLGLSKRCTECGRKASVAARLGKMKKGKPPREVAIDRILKQYMQGAASRGHRFELSRQQFEILIFGNCHYSGHAPWTLANPLKNGKYSKEKYDLGWIQYNGIDRLNNNKGYTVDNTVSCCAICNRAKSSMEEDAFRNWVLTFKCNLK